MVMRQGDVFWIELPAPVGSEPGYRRPGVVVQNDVFNSSELGTVVVCLLTSNLKWARMPGNILLAEGEANLPKPSVVNVTQLFTADRRQLVEYIGTVSPGRLRQILNRIYFVLEPREARV
jgi:mRNA interferase MazF